MNQADRMNSASNVWEADPWDASDEIAEAQLAGFQVHSEQPIVWQSIRGASSPIFGRDAQMLIATDVEFYATHDGSDMLLMQLAWRGYPDPPEWRLATRPTGQIDHEWVSWGYFAELPAAWTMPEGAKI